MNRKTLLMIHGLIGSLTYFEPQSRIVNARIETCDLLGYGSLRDANPKRLTLKSQADHVADVISRLGCGRVWLLAHSMGGAVAILLAHRHPNLIEGIINVEGNFTLKDAFWSAKIVAQSPEQWEAQYRSMTGDIPAWLTTCGLEPDSRRVEWMRLILTNQPASTVYATAGAILSETQPPHYLDTVRRVVQSGLPMHLIAGEKSAGAWDVPDFVRRAARSYVEQPHVGHLMMLEEPDAFCGIVDSILEEA